MTERKCESCGDMFTAPKGERPDKARKSCSSYCRRELNKPKQGQSNFGRRPIRK